MMSLKKAAQQALEALEKFDEQELATGDIAWLGKEITALRAALANTQDWDEIEALRASLREHMAEIHRLRAMLAEPTSQESRQVEPVAWITPGQELHLVNYEGFQDWTPLYTAPPKREPVATLNEKETVEPVAWAVITKGGNLYKAASTKESAERKAQQQIDKLGAEWECSVVPLYPAPMKREPLMDEEIEQCCYDADQNADNHTDEWTKRFARAIERAHGIGGEE